MRAGDDETQDNCSAGGEDHRDTRVLAINYYVTGSREKGPIIHADIYHY